jgi:hypothetical protein
MIAMRRPPARNALGTVKATRTPIGGTQFG